MTDGIVQVLTSLVGTLGFGFLFNVRGKKLLFASLGGALAWALFLVLGNWIESEPLCYLLVSICSTLYAEFLARKLKTPVSTFAMVNLIPLVPGGALYRTTAFALGGQKEAFVENFVDTLLLSVGLSLGIVLVISFFKIKKRFHDKRKQKR